VADSEKFEKPGKHVNSRHRDKAYSIVNPLLSAEKGFMGMTIIMKLAAVAGLYK